MQNFSKKVHLPIADSKKITTFASVLSKNSLGQDNSAVMFSYLFKKKVNLAIANVKKNTYLCKVKKIYILRWQVYS